MISGTSGSGPPAGVADQQAGRGHAGRREQFSELIGDLGGGARRLPPGRSIGPVPVVDEARGELRRPVLDIPVGPDRPRRPGQEHRGRCLRPSGAAGGGLPRRDTATAAAAPPSWSPGGGYSPPRTCARACLTSRKPPSTGMLACWPRRGLEVAGARGSGTPVLAEFSAYLDLADQPAPERHLHPVSPILCPIGPSQPHRAGI
jgi:hypothetical protein